MGAKQAAIELRPNEREKLDFFVNEGGEEQAIKANIILYWSLGWPMARTARRLGVNEKTVKRVRELFKTLGLSMFIDGKAKGSDLQAMALKLMDSPDSLSIDKVALLTMAHLSQLTEDDGKLTNECLTLLYKCAEKKDKHQDVLSDALAEAMSQ